jgi:phosphoribosylcarboxyaminoimidazole (NCAIR) mutase
VALAGEVAHLAAVVAALVGVLPALGVVLEFNLDLLAVEGALIIAA